MAQKRIQKEIDNFSQNMEEYNLKYKIVLLDNIIDTDSCNINNKFIKIGLLDKNNNLIMKLFCLHHYPFKSPEVLINQNFHNYNNNDYFIKYTRWAASISERVNRLSEFDKYLSWIFSINSKPTLNNIWKYNPDLNKSLCLCCESITCSNKWSPALTLYKVVLEYVAFRDYSLYSSKLMRRLIRRLFNNERWILPDDIILYIVKFCVSV